MLGHEASVCLSKLGIDVISNEYEGLRHWYSGDMSRDMVQFVNAKTNWELSK